MLQEEPRPALAPTADPSGLLWEEAATTGSGPARPNAGYSGPVRTGPTDRRQSRLLQRTGPGTSEAPDGVRTGSETSPAADPRLGGRRVFPGELATEVSPSVRRGSPTPPPSRPKVSPTGPSGPTDPTGRPPVRPTAGSETRAEPVALPSLCAPRDGFGQSVRPMTPCTLADDTAASPRRDPVRPVRGVQPAFRSPMAAVRRHPRAARGGLRQPTSACDNCAGSSSGRGGGGVADEGQRSLGAAALISACTSRGSTHGRLGCRPQPPLPVCSWRCKSA